ncbi:phosphatidylethanolamine-binding protein [Stachybotrys elegans]|uniref:Large ribosomal subunit protein mL38 n=1 Tax=Stachybotrys elegans TaxID=80388 RepID=A0A8K0WQW9_9HYPO|nr:phosphatidylethanolamine-binding protein [Stachybotrys elegans]
MSRCQAVARPLARRLAQPHCLMRTFTSSASRTAEVQDGTPSTTSTSASASTTGPEPSPLDLDPNTVLPQFESQLIKAGQMPIGSRRRRVAMRTTGDLPFEHLPYQAFQEARKILAADREQKLAEIRKQVERIAQLEAQDPNSISGGQAMKDTKLGSMRRYVNKLQILADINDPVVKKRFEDGLGDMDRPIYRHYAHRKWRSYNELLINQRIKQFSIVPDVLPKLVPSADVQLFFRRLKVPAGNVVDSAVSAHPPRLRVQVFDKGERLVSIVVLDADVPDVEKNGFTKRCHFLAANIPLGPTTSSLPLGLIRKDDQLAVPWLPAFCQKGAPYHRLGIFLLEQKPGERLDADKLRELYAGRDGFSLKSFRDKFGLRPFGFNMFRSVWDENTAAVMARHQLPGADVEFRPTRVYTMKTPKKARGWEAKRQGPKYRFLWKYTKRIKGLSNARGWTKRR